MTDSLGAQKIRRAVLMLQLRNEGSSLATGSLLAARNDALANILIIAAGLLTFVWEASRKEHDSVEDAFADQSAKLLIISHSNSHFDSQFDAKWESQTASG